MRKLLSLITLLGLCIGVRGQTTYRYWIDHNEKAARLRSSNSQTWKGNIDISSLATNSGLHSLHVQARRSDSGTWGPVATTFFFLSDPVALKSWGTPQMGKLWWDHDIENAISVESISGVVNLDINDLPEGLHSLHYCTVNAEGTSSPTATTFYFCMKNREKRLSHYTFWVNDYLEGATTVQFDRPLQPFSVVEMLPVTMRPIRSTSFLVEPAGQRMMVYAVNDVTVQLFDTDGGCTATTGQFVDERVSEDITNATLLVTEEHHTSAVPAEGGINWYRVEAEEGDRLRFRADRACTMQLFSPSGEEVLRMDGTAAKQFCGVDATTDGFYYLALHDITDGTGETVTVDFLSGYSRTIQMVDLLMPFCCTYDLDFSNVSGLKAYILPTFDPQGNDLLAMRMDCVPAGTGVLLQAVKAGEYKVPYTETSLYCLNLLRSTTEQTTISATDGSMANYFFTGDEETALFARVTSTKDVPAGSAYLQIPAQVVGGRQQLRVNFEDRADGVDAPTVSVPNREGWYTLDGQHLDDAPTRSGIYIKDGRKVVIK